MFDFFKREPTQAEILLAFLTLEIEKNPNNVHLNEPTHSGNWQVFRTSSGIRVTCIAGLCGDRLRKMYINGLPIATRKIKTLIKMHKHVKKMNFHKANMSDVDNLIENLIAERRQKLLK